jgi:PAS domain S-box-containing protein
MTNIAAPPAVLVVDDDDPMRYTRVRTLQPHFRTLEAADGVEALALARRDVPDLILADVRMPLMDGVALCAAIRADTALSRTPVLLISALARDADLVASALEAGADDYLAEPVAPALLVAKVRALLRRRALESDLSRANARLLREAAAREAEFRAIFESAIDGVFIIDESGHYVDVNAAGCALLAGTREQIVGRPPSDFVLLDADWEAGIEKLRRIGSGTGLVRMRRLDGVEIQAEYAIRTNFIPGRHLSFVRDVTERRQLEEQLRQSQKMEAVGRLAGGIAHDFNNLLTIILAAAEMVSQAVPEGSAAWRHSQETLDAAHRAAGLTNQLLAFSRRQVLRPVELDLNLTVADMTVMLQRVLGEQIALKVRPEPALPPVRVDVGQIGQVILNLAVNARDAMPRGGTLFLETRRVVLSPGYAQRHVGVSPGRYVLLAVSDTGTGMDEETRRRLFEPFFTTKELGKGTGLGLSTVYGIIKQSGGNIWVYSEEGHGTTFKIYLPEVAQPSERPEPVRALDRLPRGRASVLIVEDEPGVRSVASRVLERCGYEVSTASSGEEALAAWARAEGLDLLITDVVMPGISGSELVARLRSHRPDLRVLYTSGYTEDAVVHHGVASGAHFLSKPFTPADLAQKVRDVLAVPPDAVV